MSLFEFEKPMAGPLRITNPKTLKRWKANGTFQKIINEGFFYGEGCGRFRKEICTCHKCRRYAKKNNLIPK